MKEWSGSKVPLSFKITRDKRNLYLQIYFYQRSCSFLQNFHWEHFPVWNLHTAFHIFQQNLEHWEGKRSTVRERNKSESREIIPRAIRLSYRRSLKYFLLFFKGFSKLYFFLLIWRRLQFKTSTSGNRLTQLCMSCLAKSSIYLANSLFYMELECSPSSKV